MYEISTEASFSASHRLRNYEGPCENLHGHNWLVRAAVRCAQLNQAGIGIDFKALRAALREITGELDHRDLNEIFDTQGLATSSERIAEYIFGALKTRLQQYDCRVHRVEVFETPGNCAAYFEHD